MIEEKDWQYCTAVNMKKVDWKHDYATKQAFDKTRAANMFSTINKILSTPVPSLLRYNTELLTSISRHQT
jgi:hypothetical protein